jgi:cyclic beta-1,2-glucan synthetase
MIDAAERSASAARSLTVRLDTLILLTRTTLEAMEFGLLLNTDRQLMSIGYRVNDGTLDPSCYDLLASEARLASFVAIAKGDVPTRHWFHLGRTVTPVHGRSALISWSGSMFEYLMPTLVMRAPPESLLGTTDRIVVQRQAEYGGERGLPWGVSESAYNARDLERTYQYASFGVPGLGLKRGLGNDAVVAPYATALAATITPQAAVRNFARLASVGGRGRYGWYEALDYTPARLPEGEHGHRRSYMAHHQGHDDRRARQRASQRAMCPPCHLINRQSSFCCRNVARRGSAQPATRRAQAVSMNSPRWRAASTPHVATSTRSFFQWPVPPHDDGGGMWLQPLGIR